MQQGGGSHSHQHQFTHMGGGGSASAGPDQSQSSHMVVEEASPISSRPPASTTGGNLDEFMPPGSSSGGGLYPDMDALATAATAGEYADRVGSSSSSNRWPRQETLALLRIRSEMDAAFRDATVKGPLWEDVSRKLSELGYKRSAKKCREKFENVDKYYKRTKEGRTGRQDGKAYKFFTELEALHSASGSQQLSTLSTMAAAAVNFPPGIGFSSPVPISSIPPHQPTTSILPATGAPQSFAFTTAGVPAFPASPTGLDFSSNSSSSSPETEDDEGTEGSNLGGETSNAGGSRSRKRKRGRRRMMELFEGLMKKVMQKQEAMQQRFLEAIEKREQDRLIREEAWRRQEMARLSREHEIMAQERAVTASRDASIMAFLQEITGQTIQLPTATPPPAAAATTSPITPTQAAVAPQPVHVPMPSQSPLTSYQQQQKSQQQSSDRSLQVHRVNMKAAARNQSPGVSRDIVLAAVPEQQVRAQDTGGGSSEPPSSRWPKTEVIALIKLRSGLESRYQEAVPKGPLWEEISTGMQRMGYRRSAKRCKEKWENINKYFKKVKESNKKRPEDAKTCPYFHELDELYRKKVLGSTSEVPGSGQQQVQRLADAPDAGQQALQLTSQQAAEPETKGGGSAQVAGKVEEAKKPEDTVKDESIGRNVDHQQQQRQHSLNTQQQQVISFAEHQGNQPGAEDDEDLMEEDDDGDDEDEDDEELQEERKAAYKIEFQPQSSSRQQQNGPPNSKANGGGSGAGAAPATTSFMAMVQ